MQKTQKGITLIALIVTIIMLLILAGVSISVFGENGIIFTAKKAKNEQQIAEAKESLIIKLADILAGESGNNDLSKLEQMDIEGYDVQVTDIGRIVTMTKNNNDYFFFVDENFNVHELNKTSGSSTNNNTEKNVESEIIKNIEVQYTAKSTLINVNISTEQENGEQVKGYLVYLDDKLYCVSNSTNVEIKNLTQKTSYKIYCKALDKNGNYKSSEESTITTLEAKYNITDMEYPVITGSGIKNIKYVNEIDESDFYYELDLSSDESSFNTKAIKKVAYDNDDTTYIDLERDSNKFLLVDESAYGKNVSLDAVIKNGDIAVYYYDESGTQIGKFLWYTSSKSSSSWSDTEKQLVESSVLVTCTMTIPENTYKIGFMEWNTSYDSMIYEISLSD